MRWRSPDGRIELRLGDYADVLADVREADVLLADPPFSARVHAGQRTGSSTRKTTITYPGWTPHDAHAFARAWAPRIRWWSLVFSDHELQRAHEDAWDRAGWNVFAPVIWLRAYPPPRVQGDGPTSAADYVTVSRPRRRLPPGRIGSRPGYYTLHANGQRWRAENPLPGGKLLAPTVALLRDYTMPDDLVVDPCAGMGTTLLAAALEGRRAIGAERDPATFRAAIQRLERLGERAW